jgi:hypothetical protein
VADGDLKGALSHRLAAGAAVHEREVERGEEHKREEEEVQGCPGSGAPIRYRLSGAIILGAGRVVHFSVPESGALFGAS